jgi:hypothetical protein
MFTCFWTAQWSFFAKEKLASFDSKTTHAFGLYRTNQEAGGVPLRTYFLSINPRPPTFTLTFLPCC